jgi:hypothetical protein
MALPLTVLPTRLVWVIAQVESLLFILVFGKMENGNRYVTASERGFRLGRD